MANPIENLFYHKQIHRYTYVVTSLLSDLKVNTEGKIIRIPIEYMGGAANQRTPEYRAGVVPISTIKFLNFQIDQEKVENLNGNTSPNTAFKSARRCIIAV